MLYNELAISIFGEEVLIGNCRSKTLLRVNDEDLSGVEHNQVLDLSDDGDRWEGDVLNNEPYGWGVLYDSENRMVYEGFRLKDVNVCYGRSYYQDIQRVEYEGGLCNGRRWGEGTQYDRNGAVVYEGQWTDNEHEFEKSMTVRIQYKQQPMLHSLITSLVIGAECCSFPEWRSVDFSCFPNLKELEMERGCFAYVREVRIVELKKLEKVVIGSDCFNTADTRKSGFYLKKCEALKELTIGINSFRHYRKCEIVNNSSLESITIENGTFYSSGLTLKSASILFV